MAESGRAATSGTALVQVEPRRRNLWRSFGLFLKTKPLGSISLIVLVVVAGAAISANIIAPYDPYKPNYSALLQSPNSRHWFGTDYLGRDILSRVLFGARVSFYVGILAVLVGTAHGAIWGVLSGYLMGKVDLIIQRVMDAIMAVPSLILAMAIVSVMGPSLINIILAISVHLTANTNRVVRGTVISTRENLYVEAARAIGTPAWRIMALHILPNVFAPIIVLASVALGGAIIAEASLSFLGLGSPPPTSSWGAILSSEGRQYMERAPWIAIFPGVLISVTVLAFNLFGDSLRDVLDPRLKR